MSVATMTAKTGYVWKASEEDLEWVRAAQKGDLEAFNRLVLANQDSVYRLIYRLVGDEPLAEDLTQTVFLTAYQKLYTFRYGSFRSWLLRIARNESYDELRRRKRRPSVSLDTSLSDEGQELMEKLHADEPAPEEVVEGRERDGFVQQTLSRLPEEHREVLVLVDMQELDYQEAAEIVGVPIGTIKSRLARARLSFRRLLIEGGYPGFLPETVGI